MSQQPHVTLIAAMDRERVIGRDGDMPWHLPADLKHFKALTLGHPVIMGRRTFESIGRPLPGRRNIIITRNRSYEAPGCECVPSLEEALALVHEGEVMVIGGGEIYRLALPLADRLVITEVDASVGDGDVRFPAIDPSSWEEVSREHRPADERNRWDLEFVEYRRR